MLCQICKVEKSTVSLTQLDDDNKLEKVNLCGKCAEQLELNNPTGFSLEDFHRAVKKAGWSLNY